MCKDLFVVENDAELSKVLGLMKDKNVLEIPITSKKGKFIGLISHEAIVKRRNLPMNTKAEHLMISPPKIKPTDDLLHAAQMLVTSGLRSIPVTFKGSIVGIISRPDVAGQVLKNKEMASTPVEELMSKSPQFVSENDTLGKARELMRKLDMRSVPVVDGKGKISGVVGVREMLRFFKPITRPSKGTKTGEKEPVRIEVKSVMRTPPIFATPDTTLGEAIKKIQHNKISTLIITEDKKPKGIVTMADIVEYIASQSKSRGVFLHITGVEEDPEITELMESILKKGLIRINKYAETTMLALHVSHHHHEGEENFGVRLRLTTSLGMFYTSNDGWDLFPQLDESLRNLERLVRKEKGKAIKSRRRGA